MTATKYRMDPQTGKPWRVGPPDYPQAVVLNDDGSTVTVHRDAQGRIYKTSARTVPYPAEWA